MSTDENKWPLVSILIVSYNGRRHVESCLSSVLNTAYANFEVIFVDNGSDDGTLELVKKLFGTEKRLKTVYVKQNVGPAAGRNLGIMAASGKYIAFLDNDTTVDPCWLKEAITVLENDRTVGVCQSKLLLMDDHRRFDYIGDYLSRFGFLIQKVDQGDIDRGQHDQIEEIFSAKSAAMVARRDVLREIGLFDQDYFMYVEETDLCWRVWIRGYRVLFVPRSIVYHKVGMTTRQGIHPFNPLLQWDDLVVYFGARNHIQTLLKNLETENLVRILPIHVFFWIGIALLFMFEHKFSQSAYVLRGILWNLVNFGQVWKKHLKVKFLIRRVSDSYLLPRIMGKAGLTYFYHKSKAYTRTLSEELSRFFSED